MGLSIDQEINVKAAHDEIVKVVSKPNEQRSLIGTVKAIECCVYIQNHP